ncbi:MAG: PKD domain-containing protein [Draconibacterium sp.]
MKKFSQLLTVLILFAVSFTACDDDNTPTEAPVANAGDNQEVYEGAEVTLDASSSHDAGGYDIAYTWTAPEGITLNATDVAQPTFTAPDVTEDTEYEFTVTVDNGGLSTEAKVSVNVLQSDVAYLFNYGSWGNGGSSIDRFNLEIGVISNKYYQAQNSELELELTSNIQSACQYNGNFYLIANESDGIIVVNNQLVQSIDAIASDDLVNPRNAVASGDYLYVSCWGENYYPGAPNSFIAKFNITTNSVEETIPVPGGPEGLAMVNGNLYAALNYTNKVAVISLADNSITYIDMPNTCSYFLKDNNDNLYVSIMTYSSGDTGLGYINTTTNTLEDTYILDGLSSSYSSVMSANSDFSKIYTISTVYDENWNAFGSAQVFDVATETFSVFVDDFAGVNGICVNPENDNEIFIFGGGSSTEGGFFNVYDATGALQSENITGISPYWLLMLDVE